VLRADVEHHVRRVQAGPRTDRQLPQVAHHSIVPRRRYRTGDASLTRGVTRRPGCRSCAAATNARRARPGR
jgi:hypothetical protein